MHIDRMRALSRRSSTIDWLRGAFGRCADRQTMRRSVRLATSHAERFFAGVDIHRKQPLLAASLASKLHFASMYVVGVWCRILSVRQWTSPDPPRLLYSRVPRERWLQLGPAFSQEQD
jgi:hypothetical protein